MATRWVVQPMVTDGKVRRPKCAVTQDSGRPSYVVPDDDEGDQLVRPSYGHQSVVDPLGTVALSLVRGVDFTALGNDASIIALLADDQDIEESPAESGHSVSPIVAQLDARGVSWNDLTEANPWWEWLNRLGEQFVLTFDARSVKP